MANEKLAYRSVGDAVSDEIKPATAAHRLAVAAGLDVSGDPNVSYDSADQARGRQAGRCPRL